MTRYFTCWAECNGGQWEAICLDLDIAVQGQSFEEIQGHMYKAIAEYLDYVSELPQEERSQFLSRKSPLGLRLKVLLSIILSILFRPKNDNDSARFEFPISKSGHKLTISAEVK